MTTAHRPTWQAAVAGKDSAGSGGGQRGGIPTAAFSAKDLPSQMTMKFRQVGQTAPIEVALTDLKADLERREKGHFEKMRAEREKAKGVLGE